MTESCLAVIWKLPIFIFCALLLLAATIAAFFGPLVVVWRSPKIAIEAYKRGWFVPGAVMETFDAEEDPESKMQDLSAKVRSLDQGMPAFPLQPIEWKGWLQAALERARNRSQQRSMQEQLKLLNLMNQFGEECLRFEELKARKKSQSQRLSAEEEIKTLDEKKNLLTLQVEIRELEAKLKPPESKQEKRATTPEERMRREVLKRRNLQVEREKLKAELIAGGSSEEQAEKDSYDAYMREVERGES